LLLEEQDRAVPVSAFAAEFPGALAVAASFFGVDFGDFTGA
jgi:hypothetical protein